MANLETFGDLKTRVAVRVGVGNRASDLVRIGEYCLEALRDVFRRGHWPERRTHVHLQLTAPQTLTGSWAQGSATVVVPAGPFASTDVGKFLIPGGWGLPPYRISGYTDPTTVTVERTLFETSVVAGEITFFTDEVALPTDCGEIIDDDVRLLYESGYPLTFFQASDMTKRKPYPTSTGRPTIWSPAPRRIPTGGAAVDPLSVRYIRVGEKAPDQAYWVYLPYYRTYPDPADDNAKIWLHPDRRDLAQWKALANAYAEPPFLDIAAAERMEQKYEDELDEAMRSQHEEAGEIIYVESFDENNWVV